ncbi:MAG: hypothetical protein GEV06_23625 [Luteitalea sp.]|nr:hypothetical protein [Luteitalea sp.]
MMLAPSTEARRLIVVIALSAAVGVTAWRIVLGPRAARVSEKRQALSVLEARVTDDRLTSGRAAKLRDTLRARAHRLARERTRWKSPSTMATWLETVGGLAQSHGLQLHGFKPMPTTGNGSPGAWQATFDLEGTFARLHRFIGALEQDETSDLLELTLSVAAREQGRTRLRASCVVARISPWERGAS